MKPASRTHAIFLPPERSISLCTIGMSTFARLSVSSTRRRAARADGRARWALDQRRRLVGGLARQRAAVGADDDVADLQAAFLRRRVVVDLLDAQALLDGAHRHADALEAALGVELEVRVLLRREVVRELVLQRLDRGGQRLVEQLVAVDLAVVVALDRVDGLLVEAPVAVGDQGLAGEVREGVGVAAEPDARARAPAGSGGRRLRPKGGGGDACAGGHGTARTSGLAKQLEPHARALRRGPRPSARRAGRRSADPSRARSRSRRDGGVNPGPESSTSMRRTPCESATRSSMSPSSRTCSTALATSSETSRRASSSVFGLTSSRTRSRNRRACAAAPGDFVSDVE